MTRFLSLCSLILLLAGCSGSSTTGSDSFSRGADAIERYQFVEADSTLTALMVQDSTSARAAYLVGSSKEHQLLYWDAMEYYLRATVRDEAYAPAFGGLARVFSALGSEVMAADAARRCAELSGTNLDAWTIYANMLIDAGQFPEANRALSQAEAAGLPAEAGSLIKARIAFLRHDIPAAESAVSVAATSIAAKRALADYLESRGMADTAIAVSRSIFDETESHEAMVEHFFRALRVGYLYEARQMIAAMARRDRADVLPRAAWVFYYEAANEWPHGLAAVYHLQEVRPVAISTVAYLYQIAARSTNLTVAGSASEELMANVEQLKLHPVLKQYAIYRRIAPRVRLMAPPFAIIALDSVKIAPIRGELEFQAWYAWALEQFKDKSDSLPSFKEFTDAWQNHPALWTAFASTRLGFSPTKAITAETLFTKVLISDSQYRPAFDSLSEMYSFVADFAKADNLSKQYPYFAQVYPNAALRHAIVMTELGRGDEAIVEAERGIPQEFGNTVLIDQLTRALVRRGFLNQARTLINKVITHEPKNPDLLAIAARVACDQGDCTSALSLIDEGLDIEPDHRVLRAEKGRALFDSGDQDGGLKLLEDAATSEVGNSDALLYLSRRMAQQNKDQARAQDVARQAVLASPMYKRANINLAYVYLVTGRPELARGAAQTALKQYQNDAEAYFLLGKALATENKPEAKEMLQAAVQHGLIGEPLKEAQTLLQRM